ncbi:hypothetical protein DSO57_1026184 [Entomophthora muscae]|uniref:Uncharacterized protein n=2 Tax=Entomophthora muscae TaxID=34485 RepID=A0ACC2RFQ4_9FUNG|nr:hypothetical protein DSO57_1030130 [Entomophthora muscae]KAJ9053238.1 hypothetical protein DSO57_1026184 [Entomophthora muscae]
MSAATRHLADSGLAKGKAIRKLCNRQEQIRQIRKAQRTSDEFPAKQIILLDRTILG